MLGIRMSCACSEDTHVYALKLAGWFTKLNLGAPHEPLDLVQLLLYEAMVTVMG